jgi:hypothetical protein
MKNYKHSVKSNNAMKLAAVASAAIMMAPVALNSVSTFASYGSVTNNQARRPQQAQNLQHSQRMLQSKLRMQMRSQMHTTRL